MRTLERNKQKIYYAKCLGTQEILKDGKHTGQFKVTYSTPIEIKANISPANGNLKFEDSIKESYTHTLVVDDVSCPITVGCVLWVGIATTSPFNFVVSTTPRISLNVFSVGISYANHN